ncbi:ssDNA endodeoxyribonuclease SAE2 Ecym_8385 [Eremothecium cymbalariae DBVPG|uniref:DNA endonuclease activator Ctp1 C-terminal domain-containing protein n=1 Tax=Eremothecium cymbalariae (strain CBS 270.75 / DBVPG 7215 / KCTC 17166 / NRRL Y-17582) TaxID=931890 RepID=G8JXT1_ERECY|nr:Hypothetical protein Ecym_8385 [Eremothecium cymbalariae DBVPG\
MVVQDIITSSQSYEVRDWLQGLSWEHLVSLQYDIVDELARRVRDLKLITQLPQFKHEDNEDLIPTQLSVPRSVDSRQNFAKVERPPMMEGECDSEPLIPGTLELRGKQFVLSSSPLKKEVQVDNLRRSQCTTAGSIVASPISKNVASHGVGSHKRLGKVCPLEVNEYEGYNKVPDDVGDIDERISDSEGELDWVGRPQRLDSWDNQKDKKIKIDFNIHPLAKRPWIYEDFRANHEAIEELNKCRLKENRLAKMDTMAGMKVNKMGSKPNQDSSFNESFPLYENLRHRSKSPPGYGRMDFPTTQELKEEKEQAQDMIYERTKHRFKMAVQTGIPLFEREYYFKNEQLNTWVDNGEIAWSKENLQIFRKRAN